MCRVVIEAKAKILGVSLPPLFFSSRFFLLLFQNDFEPQEEVKRVLFLKISRQILDNRPTKKKEKKEDANEVISGSQR